MSVDSVVGSGILKKEDGFSDLRRRRMSLAAEGEEDADDDDEAVPAVPEKFLTRRVSFSNHHDVRIFQVGPTVCKGGKGTV